MVSWMQISSEGLQMYVSTSSVAWVFRQQSLESKSEGNIFPLIIQMSMLPPHLSVLKC